MIAEAAKWDVFVCHASEDKDNFVRPLARGLETHGLKVWFDEFTLTVGDSLRRSIDRGLAGSRFGVVVISPDFLQKEWPQRELDGLVARETGGVKVILPVWHKATADLIRRHSLTLADKVAVSSARGLEHVIESCCERWSNLAVRCLTARVSSPSTVLSSGQAPRLLHNVFGTRLIAIGCSAIQVG
jgi:hypothetical protein